MKNSEEKTKKKKNIFVRIIGLLLIVGIGGAIFQLLLAWLGLYGPIAYIIADGGALLIGYFLLFK